MTNEKMITISASGQFSKININSTDNSSINISTATQLELFEKLLEATKTLERKKKEKAVVAIEELKTAVVNRDKPSIGVKLIHFMEIANATGAVLLQHIPQLTKIIQQALA